jgi:HK97 family phage portal protein
MSYDITKRQQERIKKSISEYRNGLLPRNPTNDFFFKTQAAGKPNLSDEQLIEQYSRWVYICANRNATRVSSIPLRLYAANGPSDTPVRASRMPKAVSRDTVKEIMGSAALMNKQHVRQADSFVEVTRHPFLDLMQSINPDMTMFEMMELTEIYLELTGNAYWLVCPQTSPSGKQLPSEIWPLPPQWTRPIKANGGSSLVAGYEFGRTKQDSVFFPKDQVVHFRFMGPSDVIKGSGPLQAAAAAVLRYEAWDGYESSLATNSARPDFVLKYNATLTKEQANDIKANWNSVMRGPAQSGKVAVTDNSYEIETLGFSPEEMARLEGRKWTRLEIADAFGVPIALLDTETVNKANAETALRHYNEYTILPRLKRIEQKINEQLMPQYDGRLFVMYDTPIAEDQDARIKQESADMVSGLRSRNEIRGDRNYAPVDGGDTIYINAAQIPLPTDEEAAAISAAPPEPAPAPPPPVVENDDDDDEEVQDDEKAAKGATTKADTPDRAVTGGANPSPDKAEKEYKALVDSHLAKQSRALVDSHLAKQSKNAAENVTAGTPTKAAYDSEMVEDFMGSSSKILTPVILAAGNKGLRDAGIAVSQWIDRPETVEWINQNAKAAYSKISDTYSKQIAKELSAGTQAGESVQAIASRIEGIAGLDATGRKALSIARTETARAQTNGKIMAWKSGDYGVVAKKWDAVDNACPFCASMDGKIVGIEGAFQDEGSSMTVDDPNKPDSTMKLNFDFADVPAPPLHVNCRCDIVAVFEEDM